MILAHIFERRPRQIAAERGVAAAFHPSEQVRWGRRVDLLLEPGGRFEAKEETTGGS
jgi:hypothetical protein